MKTILVIEDNTDTRELLESLLRHEGYVTLGAEDGRQGLLLVERQPVDLVVTDMFLPEKSGFEVIEALRAKGHAPKIIAVSGEFLPQSDKNQTLADLLGVVKTFAKPINVEEFIACVHSVLRETPPA